MSRPALDGLFLDLYGTLTAGDRAAVHSACQSVIDDHKLQIPEHELAAHWGKRFFTLLETANHDGFRTLAECEMQSLAETLADFHIDADPTPYVQVLEQYWHAPPLHPDVREAVARLKLPVCIVSNADEDQARQALAINGLRFDHVVTSEAARSYKPDVVIFSAALARTGWRADRVMHVGDSLHSDVGGALSSGLHAGWLCREDRIHDIGTHEPDHTFRDMLELADWLNNGDG